MALTREQWILGTTMAAAVNALNAPFCETDSEPMSADKAYIEEVASQISDQSSKMAIEDAISVLERALEIQYAKATTNPQPSAVSLTQADLGA